MVKKNLNFWLEEADLKTPIHDEMVLWTFNNSEQILRKLNLFPKMNIYLDQWKLKCRNFLSNEIIISFDTNSEKAKGELGAYYKISAEKEFQLNNFLEEINLDYQKFKKGLPLDLKKTWNIKNTMEFEIRGYNGFSLGFLDLYTFLEMETYHSEYFFSRGIIEGTSSISKNEFNFAFEIKPEVKSIGEVLRQFQYYKGHLPQGTILILVTKTKGLKEIFESQGFYVAEYDKEERNNGTSS